MMCRVFSVSVSGYYRWRRHITTDEDRRGIAVKKNLVAAAFAKHKGNYGSPRIRQHLRREGINISKKTVAKYMRILELQSKYHRRKKYVRTTDSSATSPIAENILDRNFKPGTHSKAWCSDITYIHTHRLTAYLAIVLDIRTRKVIGYEVSATIDALLVCTALRQAVGYSRISGTERTNTNHAVIVHSDRGSQYSAGSVRELLAAHHLEQSMSRKGNCWDNAVAESFFKTLKTECDILTRLPTGIEQLCVRIEDYIHYYNSERIHSALSYKTPNEFESELESEFESELF